MSNQEFENYLRLIGKLLQLSRRQQEQIGAELQDHLESRVADLVDLGMDQPSAISQALEEFGDAAVMAKNFQSVSQLKRRRWMMRFATFSIAGCFMVAVLTMAMWPSPARFGAPDRIEANLNQEDSPHSGDARSIIRTDNSIGEFLAPPPATGATLSVLDLNEAIENQLKQTVSLAYEDVEWSEIRRDLITRFKINVVTDRTALDDSLSEEELLSVYLKDIPLEIGLVELLKIKNATIIVKDGVLRVISLDNVEDPQFLTIKTFDCRQLIKQIELTKSSTLFSKLSADTTPNNQKTSGGMGGGGMGGMGGMFCTKIDLALQPENVSQATPQDSVAPSDKAPQRLKITTREEFIIQLVSNMVGEADKWSAESGGPYCISVVNGFLVVKANREIHRETEIFLKTLEQTLFQ
jgi:hypothetical protein